MTDTPSPTPEEIEAAARQEGRKTQCGVSGPCPYYNYQTNECWMCEPKNQVASQAAMAVRRGK